MRHLVLWSGAGILLGVLAFLSPGSVFMAFLAAGTAFLLVRYSDRKNRRFLFVLFLSAFFLRVGVSVGLDALSWKIEGEHPYQDGPVQGWNLHIKDKTRGYLKISDSDYFSQRGYATAQFVEGTDEPVLPFRINQYGGHGYIYSIGWFYHLFGFSPCAVKVINCLLGSLMAVLVVLLGQRCFGTVPARWAGVLTALFPSLVLWSATNLKDIPLTFFTLLILFCHCLLLEARTAKHRWILFLLLLFALSTHTTFRSPALSILLAGSLFLAYLLPFFVRARRLWTLAGLLILLATGIGLSFLEPVGYWIRQILIIPFNWHVGFVTTPGSSYTYLPSQFYVEGYRWEWAEKGPMNTSILIGMGKAVFHYLLEPFPRKISNIFQLFSYPQMVLWYTLLPFSLFGIAQGLRRNSEKTLALILTAVIFVAISSLPNGNIGTVFRLRDMVTPLFLILSCAGLYSVVNKRSYAQGSILLERFAQRTGQLRISLEATAQRIAHALRSGPVGESLRAQPLRSAGILGIAALITHEVLVQTFGKTVTGWEENVQMTGWILSLLAVLSRGEWKQVIQGSGALRLLKRT